MKKTLLASFLSLLIFVSLGIVMVYATTTPTGSGQTPSGSGQTPTGSGQTASSSGVDITLDNPFKGGDSLFALLNTIINEIIFPIGGVLAILAFIYAGFKYVT